MASSPPLPSEILNAPVIPADRAGASQTLIPMMAAPDLGSGEKHPINLCNKKEFEARIRENNLSILENDVKVDEILTVFLKNVVDDPRVKDACVDYIKNQSRITKEINRSSYIRNMTSFLNMSEKFKHCEIDEDLKFAREMVQKDLKN